MPVHAYVLAEVEATYAPQAAEYLRELDSVIYVTLIAGPYDLLIVVKTENNSTLGKLIVNEVQRAPGIKSTLTLIGMDDLPSNGWS